MSHGSYDLIPRKEAEMLFAASHKTATDFLLDICTANDGEHVDYSAVTTMVEAAPSLPTQE